MTKKFKIIGDGVLLFFSKVCNQDGKLKKKLFRWYCDYFQFTRCEFDKKLDTFAVYYKDSNAISKGVVIRHFTSGDGIDINIHLAGSLVSEPALKFVGNEFICDFTGFTEFVYNEFFEVNPIKSMVETAKDSARIEEIINQGRISTKTLIDSVVAEFIDPVPFPMFGGGAGK